MCEVSRSPVFVLFPTVTRTQTQITIIQCTIEPSLKESSLQICSHGSIVAMTSPKTTFTVAFDAIKTRSPTEFYLRRPFPLFD
jgi:hypothetical protein